MGTFSDMGVEVKNEFDCCFEIFEVYTVGSNSTVPWVRKVQIACDLIGHVTLRLCIASHGAKLLHIAPGMHPGPLGPYMRTWVPM